MVNDAGRKEVDAALETLERRIIREYAQAETEVQTKMDAFLKKFEAQDKEFKALVDKGEMDVGKYIQWRQKQILTSTYWRDMRDTLAQDYINVDKIVKHMTGEHVYDVYAMGRNYGAYEVEHGTSLDTSFTLYNREAVERLLRDDPDLLPMPGETTKRSIAEGKLEAWNRKQLQSAMTQSILQGEPIDKIAKRVATAVGGMDTKAAIRTARTATTSAESAGRRDSYKRAHNMGIKLKQMWVATLDGRTRHEHRQLDGQTCEVGGKFKIDGEEIEYPGDPTAPGYLVYNCRCAMVAVIPGTQLAEEGITGVERDDRLEGMSYEEWKNEKQSKEQEQPDTDYGLGVSSISDQYREGAWQALDNAPEFIRKAWTATQEGMLEPQFDVAEGAYFSHKDLHCHFVDEEKAYGQSTYQENYACYFHERGHNVDHLLGDISTGYGNGALGRAMHEDIERSLTDYYYETHPRAKRTDWNGIDDFDILKRGANSDIEGVGARMRLLARTLGEDADTARSEIFDAMQNHDESRLRTLYDQYLRGSADMQREVQATRQYLAENDPVRKRALGRANAMDFAQAINSHYSLMERADIADMYDAYYCWNYGEEWAMGVGHGKDYFGTKQGKTKRDQVIGAQYNTSRMASEGFAEMYGASIAQPESLDTIKTFFPTAYEVFEQMLTQ